MPNTSTDDNDTKTPSQSPSTSLLLTLPLEIRRLIYHYLFLNTSVSSATDRIAHFVPILSTLPNILLTNRQIHHESLPLFYSLTKFHLKISFQDEITALSAYRVRQKFSPILNKPHEPRITVAHVYHHGLDHRVVEQVQGLFPGLKLFEMSLWTDFYHSDQTNWDRAMRYVMRYGEWKHAIQDRLDDRFSQGMRNAVVKLKRMGFEKRGFLVKLHWRMAHRFVEFKGDVDLDEWILRVWDPEGKSRKVFEIPQDPLEPTWAEVRLTLPPGPARP